MSSLEMKVSTSDSEKTTVIEVTVPAGTPAHLQGSTIRFELGGSPSPTTTRLPPLSLEETRKLRDELNKVIECADRKPKRSND